MSSIDFKPIQAMTGDQAHAFPDTDFVMAVKLPRDPQGDPAMHGPVTVTVHAADTLQIADELNLAGQTVLAPGTQPLKLMPGPGEIMRIVGPDGTTTTCVNQPEWKWFSLTVTELDPGA